MLNRRLFNENPLFYRIYFHAYRKHRGIRPPFFSGNTALYYDGYPRSGNTFLQSLIGKSFPKLSTVHHLHKVAPIKIALRNSIPVIILIRNPYEAISSNYLKHFSLNKALPEEIDTKLLNRMVIDYISYYTYVEQVIKQVYLIQFRDLIQSPNQIMKQIRDSLSLTVVDSELDESVGQAIDSYRGATDTYGSSRPNPVKEREKKNLKVILEKNVTMHQAMDLFERFSNTDR